MKKTILLLICSLVGLSVQGQYSISDKQLDSLTQLLAKATEDTVKFELHMQLGIANSHVNPSKAVPEYNQALNIARKLDDKERLMSCLVTFGFLYGDRGEPAKAIEMHLEALRYAEEAKKDISMPLAFISYSFEAQGDLKNALDYQRRSFWTYEKLIKDKTVPIDPRGYVAGPMRSGVLFEKMGQLDSAMYYGQLSYQRILENPIDEGMSYFYCHICNLLGTIHSRLNRDKEAIRFYRLALDKSIETNSTSITQETNLALAKFYHKTNQPDSAIYFATQAYEGTKNVKGFEVMRASAALLRTVYEKQGNYAKALYYNDLSVAARDSVSGAEKVREVQNLMHQEERRQQAIRQEMELALVAQQNRVKMYSLLAALVGVFALGFLLFRVLELRKMEAMRQAIAADLHDEVGASLTSIQILAQLAHHEDLARQREALDKLPDQARRTAAALREIVWNINPKNSGLGLLISQLTRYAGEVFEKMDIQYSIHTDDFPDTATLNMVARQHLQRIFKEALNNLAKHSQASRAAVIFKKEGHELVVQVRDNGHGFDTAIVRRGNGLDNMAQRAAAAGGQLLLRSSPNEGTETTLRLPLKAERAWWRVW